jgi:hypothetical protein
VEYQYEWVGFDATIMFAKVGYNHVEFGSVSPRSIGDMAYLRLKRPDGEIFMIVSPLKVDSRSKNFRAHASNDQIAATARLLARSLL